jgi:hypothetical protein
VGVAFACGRGHKRAIADSLAQACESQRAKTNAREWVGFGIDLLAPFEPLVLYHSAALDTDLNLSELKPSQGQSR